MPKRRATRTGRRHRGACHRAGGHRSGNPAGSAAGARYSNALSQTMNAMRLISFQRSTHARAAMYPAVPAAPAAPQRRNSARKMGHITITDATSQAVQQKAAKWRLCWVAIRLFENGLGLAGLPALVHLRQAVHGGARNSGHVTGFYVFQRLPA